MARKTTTKAAQKGPDMEALRQITQLAGEFTERQRLELLDRLKDQEGAKVTDRSGTVTVAIAGLKCQSTAGVFDAMGGWLSKARRHVRGLV
ncbi:hypothetical protein CDO87_03470 [Sagittula sp. P11]|uniref:hypothetical protein n=1 Tax=Sagittula sp. P11 TaxID=2009329 RepID=UPI000C2CE450|nr:hypothetical protein [Sagittula sp. P11]AUC52303.1 hypothetical protein CDO87_03470 [Sagittula sp. P11]